MSTGGKGVACESTRPNARVGAAGLEPARRKTVGRFQGARVCHFRHAPAPAFRVGTSRLGSDPSSDAALLCVNGGPVGALVALSFLDDFLVENRRFSVDMQTDLQDFVSSRATKIPQIGRFSPLWIREGVRTAQYRYEQGLSPNPHRPSDPMSYYGPRIELECPRCHRDHADFPGTYRDGPRYVFEGEE